MALAIMARKDNDDLDLDGDDGNETVAPSS